MWWRSCGVGDGYSMKRVDDDCGGVHVVLENDGCSMGRVDVIVVEVMWCW